MTAEHHHLDAEELVDYFSLMLDPAREQAIEEHLADCTLCIDEARRIRELVAVAKGSSVQTLAAAFAGGAPRLADAITKLIYTAHGWITGGGAVAPSLGARAAVGDWFIGEAFHAQGVALSVSHRAPPLALSHFVPEVGTLTLQVLPPLDEGDWRIIARLGDAASDASVVVGLGDAERPNIGTRTVTKDRDQQFHVAPEEIGTLQVHLSWRIAGTTHQRVMALPVETES